MKRKKFVILISILLVVTLIIVLASTVFTLKTLSFNFLNERYVYASKTDDDYVKNVKVPYGESIFLLNKKDLISDLEKSNAYLQVVSIETTFPSNIVVHVAEREELYAIKLSDNNYAITDKSLKILRFCDDAYLLRSGYLAPIVVDVRYDDFDISDGKYELCDTIDEPHVTEILGSLSDAFEIAGYSTTTLKGFATKIVLQERGSFVSGESETYDLVFTKTIEITTKYGIKISINDAYNNLDQKLALGVVAYEREHDKHNTTGEVLVYVTGNRILARYRQD